MPESKVRLLPIEHAPFVLPKEIQPKGVVVVQSDTQKDLILSHFSGQSDRPILIVYDAQMGPNPQMELLATILEKWAGHPIEEVIAVVSEVGIFVRAEEMGLEETQRVEEAQQARHIEFGT
jgi:hypothetical protein